MTSADTNRLTAQVILSAAANYCSILEQQDHQALALASTLHKTRDVKAWAKERIIDLLAEVEALGVEPIENEHAERLRRHGFFREEQPKLF